MVGDDPSSGIVPNGADTDFFQLERESSTEPNEPPVVGFVGSFEYFIDFDLILISAERLPDVSFMLVGDGREFETVRERWDARNLDNVDLPGLVETRDVPGYILQMDVCLNTFERTPYTHSAVPLKLFEYLSQYRPVVSTRIREVQRIDRDFLYYADTPDELVDHLETILNQYQALERTRPALDFIEFRYN
jgi:UDP-galactopyranose mutase